MRKDGINKIKAKTEKLVLDNKNMNSLFERLDNARDIRPAQVKRLLRVLVNGCHFETPLVAHLKNSKHRLLDGNHRHEAMKMYLERFPERKIEIWVFYYENLTEQQEREYYTKWNSGLKQSTNDFVKQYWTTIPITKIFKHDDFPFGVSHCWTSKAIEFKTLVGAYLTKNNKVFSGGYMGSAIDFIRDAKKLGKDDYNQIREFMKEYISIFGIPDKKNMHYKQTTFYSIFRIWLDNITNVDYKKMQSALIKLRGHQQVVWYSTVGGSRQNCIECRNGLLKVLNSNYRKKPLFV